MLRAVIVLSLGFWPSPTLKASFQVLVLSSWARYSTGAFDAVEFVL